MDELKNENPVLAVFLAEDRAAKEKKGREWWLAAAETAPGRNSITFAMLAVNDVFDKNGLVACLQAKGYKVEIPAR